MRIVKELIEIWPNEVCDNISFFSFFFLDLLLKDRECRKVSHDQGHMLQSQTCDVTQGSHNDDHRKVVYKLCSSCISNI